MPIAHIIKLELKNMCYKNRKKIEFMIKVILFYCHNQTHVGFVRLCKCHLW